MIDFTIQLKMLGKNGLRVGQHHGNYRHNLPTFYFGHSISSPMLQRIDTGLALIREDADKHETEAVKRTKP